MQTGYKISDVMTNKPITVTPETSVMDCALEMRKQDVGSLLIKQGENVIGIVTEQDIVRKTTTVALDVKNTPISEIMTTDMVTITRDKDVIDALVLMRDNDIRHCPVREDGKLVGFVTLKDILKIQPQLLEIVLEKQEIWGRNPEHID